MTHRSHRPAHARARPALERVRAKAQRRACVAIRTARPASTVPISQRCTVTQLGRVAKNAAIEPAIIATTVLTARLAAICRLPSVSD